MTFINTQKQIDYINNDINIDIFDMEAAGIAQICSINKIKFITIKCTSDLIDKTEYELVNINENIKHAAFLSFKRLICFINNIIYLKESNNWIKK